MLKLRKGKYRPGKRMREWLKVKMLSTADMYITGWIPGEGKNEGLVGALKCSLMDESGNDVEMAQPGAFTDEFRRQLSNDDGSLKDIWYRQVVEVSAQGVTKNNRVRHPHMTRIRIDKTPEECQLDQLEAFARV